MNVKLRSRRETPVRLRRAPRRASGPEAVTPVQTVESAEPRLARERAAGGPQDNATYHCGCGCVFASAVSTSVSCPHCGGAQAW